MNTENNEITADLGHISEPLRPLAVPIESISEDPGNLRTHSDRNISAIAASLRRFGQQRPIVIADDGTTVAGAGTLRAAKSLGWTHIAVIRTALKGSERIAFGVADNRTGDPEIGSLWDTAALASTLEALKIEDSELAIITGFSADEVAALIGGQSEELPADSVGKEYDESVEGDVKKVTCPHCGQEFAI